MPRRGMLSTVVRRGRNHANARWCTCEALVVGIGVFYLAAFVAFRTYGLGGTQTVPGVRGSADLPTANLEHERGDTDDATETTGDEDVPPPPSLNEDFEASAALREDDATETTGDEDVPVPPPPSLNEDFEASAALREDLRVASFLDAPTVTEEEASKHIVVKIHVRRHEEMMAKVARARDRIADIKAKLRSRINKHNDVVRSDKPRPQAATSHYGIEEKVFVSVQDIPGTRLVACDVPCRVGTVRGLIRNIKIDGTPWTITQSMEGPAYYPALNMNDNDENHFWSTTDMRSVVPVPYYSAAEYDIQGSPVAWSEVIKGASFLARNCYSLNDREKFVKELMKHMRVDAMSWCLHNSNFPRGVSGGNKGAVMREYAFHLAFENQNVNDYITEKLWGSLASGTLPVYLGAPNVLEYVPEHSIVHVADFGGDVAALAAHLRYLSSNETAYEEYHAWRRKPLPHWFVAKFNFTRVHSQCRLCRWAFAKKHGIPWDHEKQDAVGGFASHDKVVVEDESSDADEKSER